MSRRQWTVLGGIVFTVAAFVIAAQIDSDFKANDELTQSAPQEQVAASWAIKDAQINELRFLGVLGGVIVADLAILVPGREPARSEADEEADIAKGRRKRCVHCAELIRPTASVCRYCGRDVTPAGHVDGAPLAPSSE